MTAVVIGVLVTVVVQHRAALADGGADEGFSAVEQRALDAVQTVCADLSTSVVFDPPVIEGQAATVSDIERRNTVVGEQFLYRLGELDTLRLDVLGRAGQPPRLVAETRHNALPYFFAGTGNGCEIREIRRLVYVDNEPAARILEIQRLDGNGQQIDSEAINPPGPPAQSIVSDRQPVRVALVVSGVNYLLPDIQAGLARDHRGRLLGYDFWDMDRLPFDAQMAGSPFFVRRHGTQTASLLLRESEDAVELVSYRYPGSNLSRMTALVAHADSLGIRIVGLPLGSGRITDWVAFEEAAAAHPHMLFVVSAGNGGRDIDQDPVYPAALTLENMVVVSSADDFAGVAEGVNRGARSVDYLLPAERQTVLAFDGSQRLASGSSYAVSRMVAMAAGLLRRNPVPDAAGLIKIIDRHVLPARRDGLVAKGYIADPLGGQDRIVFEPDNTLPAAQQEGQGEIAVSVDLLRLDAGWEMAKVGAALDQASSILEQCGVSLGSRSAYRMHGPDYLQDLETGAAKTVLTAFRTQHRQSDIQVVLARDTRMEIAFEAEAFGEGNTRSRPWLNRSLWIARGAPDLGITIAHELFHILANDGRHLPGSDNLMAAETTGGNTDLTAAQCSQLRQNQ